MMHHVHDNSYSVAIPMCSDWTSDDFVVDDIGRVDCADCLVIYALKTVVDK